MSSSEIVWKFETANFTVQLRIEPECGYEYDGEDENGETQAKIDSGEYVAFGSTVEVMHNGVVIGSDSLGGSVYDANEMDEFWTAHRCDDPMNRNCTIMRAKLGNASICHYFPEMVFLAVAMARQHIGKMPKLRQTA